MSKRYGDYEQVNGAVVNELLDKLSEVRKLADAWLALEDGDFDIPTERLPTRVCAQDILEVLDGKAHVADFVVENPRPNHCEAGPTGKCTAPDCLCDVGDNPAVSENRWPNDSKTHECPMCQTPINEVEDCPKCGYPDSDSLRRNDE